MFTLGYYNYKLQLNSCRLKFESPNYAHAPAALQQMSTKRLHKLAKESPDPQMDRNVNLNKKDKVMLVMLLVMIV